MSSLVPDSRMMAEAEQALLNRKHDSTSDQRRVFRSQGIAALPSYIFFPQFDLELLQECRLKREKRDPTVVPFRLKRI